MENKQYTINTPDIAGEVIDNEAVIMDLKQGLYYSCQTTASDIWQGIEAGYDLKMIYQNLLQRYQANEQHIEESLMAFINDLQKNNLIKEIAVQPQADLELATDIQKNDFVKPQLTIHTDMQDLLLLDPIHDVDETSGWPMPKSD